MHFEGETKVLASSLISSRYRYVIFKRSTEVPFGFDQTMCCWLDNLLLHGVFPFYLPNSTYIHSFATVKVAILPFSEPWARVN